MTPLRDMHHLVIILDDFPPLDVFRDKFPGTWMPHLQALMDNETATVDGVRYDAEGATWFRHCESTVAKCRPSRAGFFWMKYPPATGVWRNKDSDDWNETNRRKDDTFSRVWRANAAGGLPRTVRSMGKMLHSHADLSSGYGHDTHTDYKNFYDQNSDYDQIDLNGDGKGNKEDRKIYDVGPLRPGATLTDDDITADAVADVEGEFGTADAARMVLVGLKATHLKIIPRHPPESGIYPVFGESREAFESFTADWDADFGIKYIENLFQRAPVDEAAMFRMLQYYMAVMQDTDARIGEIFAALQTAGAWDRTALTIVSDHSFVHGMYDYDRTDGLMPYKKEMPLGLPARAFALMRVPAEDGGRRPHRIVDTPCSLADFGATILDMAGERLPAGAQGQSLLGFVEGGDPEIAPPLTFSAERGADRDVQRACVARVAGADEANTGIFRVIRWDDGEWSLFKERDAAGRTVDPLNVTDLFDDPAHAEARGTMETTLAMRRAAIGD